jgi:hypothetical protein
VGAKETFIYTESEILAGELAKSYQATTYQRRGVVFAWQFLIPTERVEMYLLAVGVEKLGNGGIENKGLTSMKRGIIAFRARKKDLARERMGVGEMALPERSLRRPRRIADLPQ